MLAGWHPRRLVVAVSGAVKHDDTTTQKYVTGLVNRQNIELAGLTSLVQAAPASPAAAPTTSPNAP